MAPLPLTSVALVLRAQPAVASLPHVADVVSSFLGPSPNLTLARAVSFDSLKLLDLYYRHAFSKALEEAARLGLLHVVEWLFVHFSGVEAEVEVVEAAAEAGHLHILQYLFDHSTFAVFEPVEESEEILDPTRQYPNDGIVIRWGGNDAVKATNNGHDEIVQWLYEHTARAHGSRDLPFLAMSAFDVGNLPLVEWLTAHGCSFLEADAVLANRADVGRWLLARRVVQPMTEETAFSIWAGGGHLELMQLVVERHAPLIAPSTKWAGFWEEAMETACDQFRLPVVRWLLEHPMGRAISKKPLHCVHNAAVGGHLELAQLLHSHGYGECTAFTMYHVAANGYLPVVQWIHTQFAGAKLFSEVPVLFDRSVPTAGGSGGSALNAAAINGHLEVVKFLHSLDEPVQLRGRKRVRGESGEHDTKAQPERDGRKPWATSVAMDEAAAAGHLEVVQWLHANRTEGCTTVAMNGAACNGHLDVVQWLHANRTEGCTAIAMNGAAASGHLKVVQWLHANRSEGCTVKAMDKAASHGHLDVAQWLHANRSEGCTGEALSGAVEGDHFRVVQWLLMTPILDGVSDYIGYNANNSFETLLFIRWYDPTIFLCEELKEEVEQLSWGSYLMDWLVMGFARED